MLCIIEILDYRPCALHFLYIWKYFFFFLGRGVLCLCVYVCECLCVCQECGQMYTPHYSVSTNNKIILLSWNVKGLGNKIKCAQVFTHLKALKGDILFYKRLKTVNINSNRAGFCRCIRHPSIPKQEV